VPLSQALIFFGSVVNILMFVGDTHPKDVKKPRIYYDTIMMLNPGLCVGVTCGVMLHVISPSWIIV